MPGTRIRFSPVTMLGLLPTKQSSPGSLNEKRDEIIRMNRSDNEIWKIEEIIWMTCVWNRKMESAADVLLSSPNQSIAIDPIS
eukprot:19427_6